MDKMDPRIEELLPFYVLDALTNEEREFVEAYLVEHPDAGEQLGELQSGASALPRSATPVVPTRRTKDALLARISMDERARSTMRDQTPRPNKIRWEYVLQALSLGVAVIAIAWAVSLNSQLNQLEKEVSMISSALVAQSNSLDQINAKFPQITSSGVITIPVKGTVVQPQARGELIADLNSTSAVLVISGLSPLEAGKIYQVWLIDSGGPQTAGLLKVDSSGQGLLIVTSDLTISKFKSLGISVEPAGGSKQPTGDIVVLSDL